ncbi:hypothetical protein IPL68_04465 [Candidatus Saccharibacteria bacterium]|nr:MAG: hypothetical protein IPL68_04465 [Candidatus Saccharibacteria bacterium]
MALPTGGNTSGTINNYGIQLQKVVVQPLEQVVHSTTTPHTSLSQPAVLPAPPQTMVCTLPVTAVLLQRNMPSTITPADNYLQGNTSIGAANCNLVGMRSMSAAQLLRAPTSLPHCWILPLPPLSTSVPPMLPA